MQSLKVGLVGFGTIAQKAHLVALRKAEMVITAICETYPAMQQEARCLVPEARVYENFDEMLEKENIDWVDICTPPDLHFSMIKKSILAKKHVLCEKPLVLEQKQAQVLKELTKEHPYVVGCVHNWTKAPILLQTQQYIKENYLGNLREIVWNTYRQQPALTSHLHGANPKENWRVNAKRSGGGIVFDHGWHAITAILRLTGLKPVAVRAVLSNEKYHELSVEDTAHIELHMENGLCCHIHLTWAAKQRQNTLLITGEQGEILLQDAKLKLVRSSQKRTDLAEVAEKQLVTQEQNFLSSLSAGGYQPDWVLGIVKDFLHEILYIENRGDLLDEALLTMQCIDVAYQSNRENNKTIKIN